LALGVTTLLLSIGCNLSDCRVDTHRDWVWGGGGIMNDSVAMLNTGAYEEEFCSGFGSGGPGKSGNINCKLILADIRKKKIYFEKKIADKDCNGMRLNVIQDSVLLFRNGTRIAFLNLKDVNFKQSKPIELKIKEIEFEGDGWKYESLRSMIRPWQNGLMLTNSKYERSSSSYGNEYALLDTATGIRRLWQPNGEFEWLNECADAKWSSIGGLCLKEMPDTLGFVLLKNGIDTLAVRYMPYGLPSDYKGVNLLSFNGNGIILGGWIYLMDGQGHVLEKPLDTWAESMGFFYNLSGGQTSY